MTTAIAPQPAGKPATPQLVTRALSVCEPWAWAIVAGWKPIENRTWGTNFTGTIAIHAGTTKRNMTAEVDAFLCGAHPRIEAQLNDKHEGPHNPLFYFGAILGTVDVIGCVEFDPQFDDFDEVCRAAGFGDWLARHKQPPAAYWSDGRFCWLLENPRQFTQPVPAKGKLNLYRLDPSEIASVNKALRGPLGSPVEYRAKLAGVGKAAAKPKLAAKGK